MRNLTLPQGQPGPSPSPSTTRPSTTDPYTDYIANASGPRIFTPAVSVASLRAKYPSRTLTCVRRATCDLLSFAAAGHAVAAPVNSDEMLTIRRFQAPERRHSDEAGEFVDEVVFAACEYRWRGAKGMKEFLVYVEDARDGIYGSGQIFYVLGREKRGGGGAAAAGGGDVDDVDEDVDELVEVASKWLLALHEEVLVFDQGFWRKDKDLWRSIQKASWEDVILKEDKKKALQDDVRGFFESEESYKEFAVPWKRGLIFYGPPGNGKTISIKALMHSASKAVDPTVEMLYVKSFSSFQGPEAGIAAIFRKARELAPCMLIFEDIDSLVGPNVRSYFLNAVDGLESNHGILMIGSTNHLERLDPGIAKRPSRFDRKFLFSQPDRDERVQYAQYWRQKLKGNKKVDFPEELCGMIADITDDFSFAYLKEAFVAALLAIVAASGAGSGKDRAEDSLLWKQIKIQVKILRDEMDDENQNQNANERAKVEEVKRNDGPLQRPHLERFPSRQSDQALYGISHRRGPLQSQFSDEDLRIPMGTLDLKSRGS